MTNYDKMTKEELIAALNKNNEKIEKLEQSKGQAVKDMVKDLIEQGFNCIEDIAAELDKSSKNISSNLTYLRKDLQEDGKTIVSQRIDNKTYLSIQPLSIFGI